MGRATVSATILARSPGIVGTDLNGRGSDLRILGDRQLGEGHQTQDDGHDRKDVGKNGTLNKELG